jgi:hypothetical protein
MGRKYVTVEIKEVTEEEFEFNVEARAIVIKTFDPAFEELTWDEMLETERLKFMHIARMQLRTHFTIKDEEPKTKKVLIRGTHHHSFRTGEWAELKGFVTIEGPKNEERECYSVVFPDGVKDLWATDDSVYEFKDASE